MTLQTFKIRVFQRRIAERLAWTTVGLGETSRTFLGRSDVKLQRKLGEDLGKAMKDLPNSELARFQIVPGAFLRHVYLDVNMRLQSGKTRLVGEIPLICSPRQTTAQRQTLVVNHPYHEERWFVCDSESDLTTLATQLLRHSFGHLDSERVEVLKKNGKEMLRTVSFSAEIPTLLDRLPKKSRKRRGERQAKPVLERIGTNQTLRAIEGTLPLGLPRRSIRQQLSLILGGKRRSSVLLVGEPGAGKSTVINRWVADDLEQSGYPLHRDLDRVAPVWRVSGKRIIAGMSYLGDWEKRCLDLLAECQKKSVVLWVDDIHAFGRLGQTRDSDRNLAEFFRSPVGRGDLTIVAECTASQQQRFEDDAPSFASLFRTIRLAPTSDSETTLMMLARARELEQRYRVRFDAYIYKAILELGASLYPWTSFPGKALDLLERLARSGSRDEPIAPSDLVALLAEDTGLPGNLLTLDEPIDTDELREGITSAVIGQPVASETAVELALRVRSGLTPASRPLAVYLFTGPTGTGKTELAKVIARYLYGDISRLIRIDMSEYATGDAVARLIGDTFKPEGHLTRRIRQQPFSIVLLDEIEKAHPAVLYLLLQLFDEGRLTDAAGNTASFANAVVVMTSNLGAKPTRPIGFGGETRGMMADISRAVRDFFPPELFNRIDAVVPFRPLSVEAAESIATKEMAQLFGRRGLVERNIFVVANRAVKQRIVREAFDPRLGARTVKRYLEDEIGGLLVDEVTTGGTPRLRVLRVFETEAGELAVHSEALGEAEADDSRFFLADAVELTPAKLTPLIEEARELVASHLGRAAIERVVSGCPPELAYFADRLRQVTSELPTALSAGPASPAGRAALIKSIVTATHLARNLEHFGFPEAHAVWLDLSIVGQARAPGAVSQSARLIGWLASAYATARPGWFDGFAIATSSGKTISGKTPEEFAVASQGGTRRVSLLLSGLFASDAFAGETGSHIWQPSSAEPEIVSVDVASATSTDTDARARLSATEGAVRRFEEALSIGQLPLPPNPDELVGAVRSLRFGLPLRPTDVFPIDVLDFRTQASVTVNVSSVPEVINAMIDNWCGRKRSGE